jgi:hypothetical protein
MGYFTSIADQAFKVGTGGETLFYLGGPLSRPLVIKEEQAPSTYAKHLWMQRVFLTILILGQPFLFVVIPSVIGKLLDFICYGISIMLLNWLLQRIVFRQELAECSRLPQRLSLRSFYGQVGDKHTEGALIRRLVGSVIFVLSGIGIAFSPTEMAPGIGVICSLFFGACGIGWWYALRLKRARIQEANKASHHNPLPAPSSISRDHYNPKPESKLRPR